MPSGHGGHRSTMVFASSSSPTTWWISGTSPSVPLRVSTGWIPRHPVSLAKATSLSGPARSEPSPISRSSASGALPTRTRWRSWSGGATSTSSEPLARQSPTRSSRSRSRLDRLRSKTDVSTGLTLEAADVLSYGAELVVLATGSRWAADGFNGLTFEAIPGADASQNFVLTPEQVMLENKRPPGEQVIVYDCDGYFMGAGIAELLRLDGYQVTIVTPHLEVAPLCNETLDGPRLRHRLHEIGIEVLPTASLSFMDAAGVRIRGQFAHVTEVPVNAVVLVTQRLSCAELYNDLTGQNLEGTGVEGIYRIGDWVAPRVLRDAIFDGHPLGREIDSVVPSTPLPHSRERLVAGEALRD